MSDALNDAIRAREKHEAARADGVAVYVVKIEHTGIDQQLVIGSVHWDEEAAQAEVKRLNKANKYTRASYVRRMV